MSKCQQLRVSETTRKCEIPKFAGDLVQDPIRPHILHSRHAEALIHARILGQLQHLELAVLSLDLDHTCTQKPLPSIGAFTPNLSQNNEQSDNSLPNPSYVIINKMALGPYKDLRVDQHDRVFVITLQKAPENRINVRFAQEIIRALRDIEAELGPDSEGCVITRGNDEKFWCTGLELDEADTNPFANSDGFFPVR